MKRHAIMAAAVLLTVAAAMPAVGADIRARITAELSVCPEKSGGIYYAYPSVADSLAPVPAGFEPVYISHYGRHGSRWVIDMSIYPKVLKALLEQADAGNLTPAGKALIPLVESCAGHARGHAGELSPLGERQHRAIAGRLARRFPALFADTTRAVVMRSSTEPRCIISMAAFSEALKSFNPALPVERHATPGDMEFINYSTPEAKDMGKKDAPWMHRFGRSRDSLTRCEVTARRIFLDPAKVKMLPVVMRHLHDIAIDVQDVDGLPEDCAGIIRLFSPVDLYNLWLASNYMMYVRHADSADGRDAGPRCAANLLKNIVERADTAVAGIRHTSGYAVAADLRFGHDTALIRLLSLMGVEDCSPAGAATPEEAAAQWQTYNVSPMGANLQLIFFRNAADRVIVGLRLNERPVRVGVLHEYAPGYYDWNTLREQWQKKLQIL